MLRVFPFSPVLYRNFTKFPLDFPIRFLYDMGRPKQGGDRLKEIIVVTMDLDDLIYGDCSVTASQR